MKSPDEMENRLETDFNNEGKAGRGNAIEEQNEPEVMPKAKRQRKNKAARGSLSEKLSALFDFSEEAELAKAEKKAEAVEAARREAKLCAKKVKAAGERYSLALEEKENGRMKSSQLKAYAKDVKKLHTKAVGATKKYRRLKKQSQKKLGGFTSVLVTIDIFAAICFFVFYGPFASFRDTYITTAMSTSSHRYLANIFYSQATIDRVVSENTFIGTGLYTDASAIKFTDVDSITSYSTVYEEQILKKDEGNDLYKLLEFDGATYHGYIVVLYDASRITNVLSSSLSSGGQMLTEIAAENEAIIAINSGGFNRLAAGQLHCER